MTSPIEQLLARARLVNEPYSQEDIRAGADRIAARVAARVHGTAGTPAGEAGAQDPVGAAAGMAAQDLRNLCETVVTSGGALVSLRRRFFASVMPEPPGARVLGCILLLAEHEDSAQFWWQYAAGAGDPTATYCLYLHHRARGEDGQAEWWHVQADVPPATHDEGEAAQELATALRVLSWLKMDADARPDEVSRSVSAVLGYVPAALAYVDDDLELPMPIDADFAHRIKALASAPSPVPRTTCRGRRTRARLPERKK
ncbi:hypothetical protein ACFRKB_35080 [Streptomyces scopuliridis]|uniref:hypothetical protein n=1 Tax=Streptomyces scopuliridis TaxID=452529 RepID=UPI0036791A10